jgi:hypothetical protein
MAKKVKAILKLNLPAGEATPAPPVGPALGQHGVPIMELLKNIMLIRLNKKVRLFRRLLPFMKTVPLLLLPNCRRLLP